MKIFTLTLNPAFDIHASIPSFLVEHENLASSVSRDIGGKGVNISRALNANGIPNLALVVLGEENGAEFKSKLEAERINYKAIFVPGRIRENITIHPDGGKETRLSFKGFESRPDVLDNVGSLLDINSGDIVTFTGSLPVGMDEESAVEFLLSLRERGVKLVIDSKSIGIDSIRRVKPWLIKPNEEELTTYMGTASEADARDFLIALSSDVENVLVSLGARGALLASGGRVISACAPKIDAKSTIGAGDSMIAGFIAAEYSLLWDEDRNASEALRLAVAFGSAACLTEGTNPPRHTDIRTLKRQVLINETG